MYNENIDKIIKPICWYIKENGKIINSMILNIKIIGINLFKILIVNRFFFINFLFLFFFLIFTAKMGLNNNKGFNIKILLSFNIILSLTNNKLNFPL